MRKNEGTIIVLADVSGKGDGYHIGDEAMAEVAIERLSDIAGRENIVLACTSAKNAGETYGVNYMNLYAVTDSERKKRIQRRPHSALKEYLLFYYQLKRCRLVFVAGGGNMTSVWPEVLESRLHFLGMAKRMKKPIILASQTLGPYTPEHREKINQLLTGAAHIGVRDDHYSKTQVTPHVEFAVDDAVFLKKDASGISDRLSRNGKGLLAISMRNFRGVNSDQQDALANTIHEIAQARKLHTIFIPHHAEGGQGDLAIAKRISSQWDSNTIEILYPIPYASEVKALTSECSLVISMRYHQLIFSLSTGTPCIGIYSDEYTQAKLTGAFRQFGLVPRVLSINEAQARLKGLADQTIDSSDEFKNAARSIAENAIHTNMAPYIKAKEIYQAN